MYYICIYFIKIKIMFKSISLLIVPILFLMTSASVYSQQDVFFPMGGKGKGKKKGRTIKNICFNCWEAFDNDKNYEYTKFPLYTTRYADDLEILKQKAKEALIGFAYGDFREHTLGARDVMINHAEQFIKVRFDDFVMPTSRKEKRNGKGNYKIYVMEAQVNKELIKCLCKAIDQYMSDNLVVLYKPNLDYTVEEIDMYESARDRTQAEYVNQEYKRTSCQNIDVQPVCEIQETNPNLINYYRELIQCVNLQKGVDAKIAAVIREIMIKNVELKSGGIYESIVEVHFQAFNTNTNSFVMDEFFKGIGYSKTRKGSIDNCIQEIVEKNTRNMMHEEAEKYYNSCQDGKDFYVFIPDTYSEDELVELMERLDSVDCINVTNENTVRDGTEIKCETWIPRQSNIMKILRYIKPQSMGRVVVRAEYFAIKPK